MVEVEMEVGVESEFSRLVFIYDLFYTSLM